ncbi:MAG: protein kinase [Gammaproteobacteria bacterium]|nr:protein kinase [Gammaproteobacteria bacterium]
MALKTGFQIGPYKVTTLLGAGGMGEVYRATDTKLRRDVAIKVLPDGFAQNAERLARFEREAHLLASLNHPNIAAIYGLEESGNVRCLVLELVEGETLAERLARGALPLDEALKVVRQIASALEAAHEKGIIHRDLKPANVKILPDGTVKVLDFGLAKALQDDTSVSQVSDLSLSPTVSAGMTRDGVILGTAPYMSPEQARGKPVDKRTDIWSLGCVFFECLTGRRLFNGETTTDVLAQILTQEPDFGALPRGTPDCLARLMRRCLDKNPGRRLRDVGELRIMIDEFESNPASDLLGPAPAPARRGPLSGSFLLWAIVAVLGIALAYSLSRQKSLPLEAVRAVSRWPIALPSGSRLGLPGPGGRFDYSRLVTISPDGSRIAYAVQDKRREVLLHVRDIDAMEPRPLPGTANARAPFFSPDGRWLGFLVVDRDGEGTIQKVALTGGSPQKLCDVGRPVSFDASWSPDGETIVFATDNGLWRVSASGGSPEQLTRPDPERGEVGHHSPRITPDGRGVFFTISITPATHLALLSLDTLTWEIVIRDASQGLQLGTDRLVFARSGELLAAPYDVEKQRVFGSTLSVMQGVHTSPGLGGVVLTHFDLSNTGTLVYVPDAATETVDQLLWVDRDGNESVITSGVGTWVHPRLSPDGQRISLDIHSPDGMRDVYVYEMERGQMRQLTEAGITWESEWRPDGRQIAIMSGSPAGQWSLFWARSDFSGPPERLLQTEYSIPSDWFPDGQALIFTYVGGSVSGSGIWKLPLGGERKPEVLLNSSARERHPRLSPDGNWIAYTASESGRRQVFVQSFPDLGPKHQISIAGGGEPVWSPDGRELFFRERDRMFIANVHYEPFRAGRPRVLFTGEYDAAFLTGHQHYDISLDGKKFLMIKHGEPVGPSEVQVVLNWSEELK